VVTRAFATSPLRLLTPANHGHAAWVYTSSYGGGLVNGDHLDVDVTVGPGACAFLSTQASTKVYRSPRGTGSTLGARVDRDALLIVAPDPVVCFAGARYRQAQRFDLDESGALVLIDGFTSGRRASGERWAFSEYRSQIEVTLGGRRLVHDATALRAADGSLEERLGRFHALATLVLAGRPLATESARLVSESASRAVVRRGDQLMAASPLGDDGCLVRVAGISFEQVWRSIRDALPFVPGWLGDDPWSRKW
jgi:urease accessory protein